MRAIYKDADIESIEEIILSDHSEMVIQEKLLSYEVVERSPYSYSFYRIGKSLGIIWKSAHESLAVDPAWEEEQANLQEIE